MDDDAHLSKTEEIQAPLLPSVEEMIEQSIGHINSTQIVQAILASMPTFFDSQQTFMSVFAHALPPWHCTATSSPSCISGRSNMCDLPGSDWVWDSGDSVHTSILSEWDLECASSFVAGFPTTCYFTGCLLGGLLLPTLGDAYLGRKNLLCLCSLIMCSAALASAFSPNLWAYSFFRFISGVGRAPLAICALVLLTERVTKRWRGLVVMIGYFALSIGALALTLIAYLTRNLSWRILYLCTSTPGIICTVLCYFFMHESPRWLLMQGRTTEAMIVIASLGQTTDLPNNRVFDQQKVLPTSNTTTTNNNNNNPLVSLKVLVSKKWAVKRLLASIFPAFGIGLVYFGLLLGVENLGYNIYLTTILDALLSLSTYLLAFLWWVQHCDRKSSLISFCTVGGVMCIILSVIDTRFEVALILVQLVALFCACMAVNILFMYMVELFPTCVRNSASSVIRLALILGSVFVPTLNLLGRKSLMYSYGLSGLVMLVCGFLFLCLPETRGKKFCDTMEEQELMENNDNSGC